MARLRATASAARSVLDGREHGGTLGRVGEPIHTNPTIKKRARKAIKNRDHAYIDDRQMKTAPIAQHGEGALEAAFQKVLNERLSSLLEQLLDVSAREAERTGGIGAVFASKARADYLNAQAY